MSVSDPGVPQNIRKPLSKQLSSCLESRKFGNVSEPSFLNGGG